MRKGAAFGAVVLYVLLGCSAASGASPKPCGVGSVAETLNPYGDLTANYLTDLKVVGTCKINGSPDSLNRLLYVFHNVNIVAGGKLIFEDDHDIDFYAESILIENGAELIAVSTQKGLLPQAQVSLNVLPFEKRLTFHLWGKPNDPGIVCASDLGPQGAPCGIPDVLWSGSEANTSIAHNMMMSTPPPPSLPKNQPCNPSATTYKNLLPNNDCFYKYEIQDQQDISSGTPAYFGHKVLALSLGGTLQLFGVKGVSYLTSGELCKPSVPNNECNPAFTGGSWARLTTTLVGHNQEKTFTLDRIVHWKVGDQVVITTTDYLPTHSEVVTLAGDATISKGVSTITVTSEIVNPHWGSTYPLPSTMPATVGPQNDPNAPGINRAVDTRAAVALLTRNIQVVSEGDVPSQPFTETAGNYYGGHTIARQGFMSYKVQGVEFFQLGQGGQKGRYPVHFHMARKTLQPTPTGADPTPEPLTFLKDCSIHDSMTRWVTVHATEGMYVARNVGYKSIGHGYYLEDATEVNNKLYSNVGILARAAINDTTHNPRQVPGILADNEANAGPKNLDYMPFRSDYNHPTVFWITNGWNDFQYNFAAGAATCGSCYWWIGAGVSGPSVYQTWDGYASQQIRTDLETNYQRAGITPLDKFVGNSCVAAMSSFQMNGQTGECLGMQPSGTANLAAVESSAPPGPDDYQGGQPFQIYYPVLSDLHNPTICIPDPETNDCSAGPTGRAPCTGGDYYGTCTVTQLDRYTTSFNFAQTNFAAVWLRKGWDLFTNGAVTDVQTGGLNFITGGGYTRSDVGLGEWLLARNTILVGHTQTGNSFASDVGPVNGENEIKCDNTSDQVRNYCAYADGGLSFNLPILPGQKLLNIYDGPSHQDSNAYMAITASTIKDCSAGSGGTCYNSPVPLAWNFGVLQNKSASPASCYLPNAAIAWKQPNGFYYPPAFHSRNLWFNNVDIRHFVVEPLFEPITPDEYDPFQQNQDAVMKRYCTYTVDMFSAGFNSIDRQTVLNDDDGTLTGLVGAQKELPNNRPSISINEDDFFNAPLATPECLSDINVKPLSMGIPYTATTSPYEWLTTAVIADCARGDLQQCIDPQDPTLTIRWGKNCGSSFCRGVPLYREYLTTDELTNNARPQIRMMGQDTGQRSTLSLNKSDYYIDTTQNCTSQGGCPKCAEIDPTNKRNCLRYESDWRPSLFLGGQTYY